MMATGYTHPVADGEITDLRAFVLQCARAMGACIMMRDEPWDAPIPEAFEPSTTYHDEQIVKSRALLDELASLSPEQAAERAAADYEANLARHVEYAADEKAKHDRVRSMRGRVAEWETGAEGIKTFMLEQLDTALRGGPYEPEPPVRRQPFDWLERALEEASRSLAYHETKRAEEIERTAGRNEWLRRLRASLPDDGAGNGTASTTDADRDPGRDQDGL